MASTDIPFIELLSADPRYRKLVGSAIRNNDQQALQALKGKLGQPIHFVTNWFMYCLMMDEQDLSDRIVIWSPQIRLTYHEFTAQLSQERSNGGNEPEVVDDNEGEDIPPLTIPVDTYSFLK